MEEGEARAFIVEAEQPQFPAQLAMIPLTRHLEALQVLLQFLPGGKGGAVNTGEHGIVALAAPVSSGHRQQTDGADLGGVGDVRPAAEVDEATHLVGADDGVGRQIADQFQLVGLVGKEGFGLLLAYLAPLERLVCGDQSLHLRGELGQVVLPHRPREIEVVVEAVLDRRTDGHLGARKEPGGGLGQNVRRRVADHVQTFARRGGKDAHLVALGERDTEIDDSVSHAGGYGRFGQPRPNRGRDIGRRGPVGDRHFRSIGQQYLQVVPSRHKTGSGRPVFSK